MMRISVEKTASRGIVVSPAFQYVEPDLSPDTNLVLDDQVKEEVQKFEDAKKTVCAELEQAAQKSEIFAAHIEIADDFTLQEGVVSKIKSQNKNVQLAMHETVEEIATMFSMIDDPYMQERSADIKDVGKRYMATLKGVKRPDLGDLTEEVIVVAKDMYPSDTVKINTDYVKGIITEEGGVTSHVFIIAKSMDIPILVGVSGVLAQVQGGQTICMDAEKGDVIINPTAAHAAEYAEKKATYLGAKAKLEALRGEKVITKDGRQILLAANVGGIADIQNALKMNIDGVGLFRSEFLYMENAHFPTETEQFKVYKEAVELCPSELTIRTLDIGGDKELSYFEFDKEENPFLGWRAVRICLEMQDMFKEQIRAILKASAFGHVRMMIPMIISLEEITAVKEIVEICKAELTAEQVAFDKDIQIGMMMETPSSVMLAEEFAKEVDFFSIGTNDLTQYLLAVDRGNKKIADKYSYFHPAVTKAIRQIIEAGHAAGIPVGMCGEMAGDLKATALLLEMGLDEFSMSASSIDYVREFLLKAVQE